MPEPYSLLMVNHLVTINRKPLRLMPGFPPAYGGNVIYGSEPTFAAGSWGEILVQTIQRLHWRLSYRAIKLKWGRSIRMTSAGSGLTTTAVLKNSFTQTVSGVGRTFLQEHQFVSAFKDAWTRRIDLRKNAEIITLDATWDRHYLETRLPGDNELKPLMDGNAGCMPVPVGAPYRNFTPAIGNLIDTILNNNPSKVACLHSYDRLMEQLLTEVLIASKDQEEYVSSIPPAELRKVRAARELILNNSNMHMTIADIARAVDLNEFTLKSRFRQLEGKGLFEFLLWMRCRAVVDDVIHTTLPLKVLCDRAGYADRHSFARGFKKHMGCSPAALRRLYSLK